MAEREQQTAHATHDADVHLWRDQRGRLTLRMAAQAEPIEDVRVARCFPWSQPDRYVSIRGKDGKELHLFESLDGVVEDTRRVIDEELATRQFIPRITAIDEVDDHSEVTAWRVQTECGPIELQVKSDEDVRQLDASRLLIKDHAGGIFEVPDMAALDDRSRRLIEENMA